MLQDYLGTYIGEWSRGLRKGHGKQTYYNDSSYAGNWFDDKPHGTGAYQATSGWISRFFFFFWLFSTWPLLFYLFGTRLRCLFFFFCSYVHQVMKVIGYEERCMEKENLHSRPVLSMKDHSLMDKYVASTDVSTDIDRLMDKE